MITDSDSREFGQLFRLFSTAKVIPIASPTPTVAVDPETAPGAK